MTIAGSHAPRTLHYVGEVARRYLPAAPEAPLSLGIPCRPWPAEASPGLTVVPLPDWAGPLAPEEAGGLPVPIGLAGGGAGVEPWRDTDWLSAIAWYLHGEAERRHEARHGTVQSYSLRLAGFDPRHWERAWVNRIALFLRAWAERESPEGATTCFGPRPDGCLHLSHDVDAIRKTLPIRGKQAAFRLFNAARHVGRGQIARAGSDLAGAIGFALRPARYWWLPELCAQEMSHGLRSRIHVFAGLPGSWRNPGAWLIDPGYDIAAPASRVLVETLRALHAEGWEIGLHPAAGSYRSGTAIAAQRTRLEEILQFPVASCRQHWLTFSWGETWSAQVQAGLREDSTLGFNDRPGFRVGAALPFRPWDDAAGRPLDLTVLPLAFMDSHFYDYRPMTAEERRRALAHWLREILATGGECACLWHPHTLGPDYGWGEGFRDLLALLAQGMEAAG